MNNEERESVIERIIALPDSIGGSFDCCYINWHGVNLVFLLEEVTCKQWGRLIDYARLQFNGLWDLGDFECMGVYLDFRGLFIVERRKSTFDFGGLVWINGT